MVNRKYISEIALSFYSDGILLLHPTDINNIELQSQQALELANDCHIYLIVKRPRVTFVPESINIEDEKTTGKISYRNNGVKKDVNFHLKGKANADSIEISDYPHNNLFMIKNGEIFFTIPAHLLSIMCDYVDDQSIRDLEVVYVGMSYAKGKRSAKDRLLSHSTLQKVLSDINLKFPDMEALIIMAQYVSPQTFISFDGRDKTLKPEGDRDVMADIYKQQTQISKDLEISLIEAGLIRYFEPQYNEKFKKTFPDYNHKILKEVYEIDFGGLTVEIDTEEIKCRLFSEIRKPGYHHIGSFDLHDPNIRRSFFNLMDFKEGSNAPDHSGPIF
jgi:hypothetical protein